MPAEQKQAISGSTPALLITTALEYPYGFSTVISENGCLLQTPKGCSGTCTVHCDSAPVSPGVHRGREFLGYVLSYLGMQWRSSLAQFRSVRIEAKPAVWNGGYFIAQQQRVPRTH